MIINTPVKLDFEIAAKENLTQAFDLLFKVYENYVDYDELIKEEVTIDDLWTHNNGTIRTSLILLYQAIEGLMKATICETSPLLLIDKPRKDWPSLPNDENKDFDSLYSIGGESLLTTFCATNSKIQIDSSFIHFIEDIRQKRNQIIHGTTNTIISPKFIIESILKTFTIWFGKNSWLAELKANLLENPLFGYFDSDYESTDSYKYLDFVLLVIGKNILSKHLSIDIKGRAYFCPECKYSIESEDGWMDSKWAFLSPNNPTSNRLTCVNCNTIFEVIRDKCNEEVCKGNVLCNATEYKGSGIICLTCFKTQE
jgi:hypothetical protein